MNLIKSEPVMFQAVIQAGLAMVMSFGVRLSAEQMGTVLAFTAAVLGFWARQNVTSHPNNPLMNGTLTEQDKPMAKSATEGK
jgi:hypothetical protein